MGEWSLLAGSLHLEEGSALTGQERRGLVSKGERDGTWHGAVGRELSHAPHSERCGLCFSIIWQPSRELKIHLDSC